MHWHNLFFSGGITLCNLFATKLSVNPSQVNCVTSNSPVWVKDATYGPLQAACLQLLREALCSVLFKAVMCLPLIPPMTILSLSNSKHLHFGVLNLKYIWNRFPEIAAHSISESFYVEKKKTKKTSKDKIIWYLKIMGFSTQFSELVSPVFNNTNHCIVPTKNWYSDYPISKYHLALNTKGQEQSFSLAWQSFTTLNDLDFLCRRLQPSNCLH